jgi:hypothetical protein
VQNDIFGGDSNVKRKKESGWVITDHACRSCFGRILKRRISPTVTEVSCSECGASSYGVETVLCFCGKSVGRHGEIFNCIKNPNPRPELPNVILVREKKVDSNQTKQ